MGCTRAWGVRGHTASLALPNGRATVRAQSTKILASGLGVRFFSVTMTGSLAP
jgi:hypothetical protein